MITLTPAMFFIGGLIAVLIIVAALIAFIEVKTDTTWPEWPERLNSFLKRRSS